jgi:alanine racemase
MTETPFYRDTWVEVNLDAIEENVKNIVSLYPNHQEIYVALKANAYGHGYIEVAKQALNSGATRLLVAFIDEGIYLRNNGIEAPILVLGATRPKDVNIAIEHKLTLTAYNVDWLEEIAQNLTNKDELKIHMKFDTGMGRLGLKTKAEWEKAAFVLRNFPSINLEGIFTHFATADELDKTYFNQQVDRFYEYIEWVKNSGFSPSLIHCANSAAAVLETGLFNTVRVGIVMYGLTPSLEIKPLLPFTLKPALSLYTKISHIKQLPPNSGVSYGATYKTSDVEWIATLPIGYADGWLRDMQGFSVLVEGEKAEIVGRVCMDQCMIKLSKHYPVGTKVTLIGESNGEIVSAEDVAMHMNTINYEVTCLINNRVPKVYKHNGNIKSISNYLVSN